MSTQYKVEKGRPENTDGRLEKEIRCYDMLDRLGIEYWRCDHPDAAAYTMEACKAIDEALDTKVCKNLFLTNRQHTEYYLLLMPADKVFKTKELPKQIGCTRLSFASSEEMEEMLDCAPGSSSILGLMNDHEGKVRLLVDEDLLKDEFFGCHPCINTTSLKVPVREMFGKYLKEVGHDMTIVRLVGDS